MSDLLRQKNKQLARAAELCLIEAGALVEVLESEPEKLDQQFAALQADAQKLSEARQAAAAQIDTQATEARSSVATYLENTKDRFVTAVPDLESLLEDGGELMRAFHELGNTLDRFRDAVEESRDELEQGFDECAETLERVVTTITECLTSETTTLLETLLEQALERLEKALMETADKAVASVRDKLENALADFEGIAKDAMEDALGGLEGLKDTLLDKVSKSGESVIEDEVSSLARDIVEETLSSVLDDVAMTQISAQVTAALSSQLPQLTAAKHAVGAVKRLLDIMRSGGI